MAKAYFTDGLFTDAEVQAWIDAGQVPVASSAASKLAGSADAKFLQLVYDLVSKAPELPAVLGPGAQPRQAEALLNNIDSCSCSRAAPSSSRPR